jgi:hypothetical protein
VNVCVRVCGYVCCVCVVRQKRGCVCFEAQQYMVIWACVWGGGRGENLVF